MSSNTSPVPAYRVTNDDLPDADKKLQRAIEPLLEQLNRCLGAIVAALNAISIPSTKMASFTTDGAAITSFQVKLVSAPTELWLTALAPRDSAQSITTNFAMWWTPTKGGAVLNFIGLSPNTVYDFSVRYF